MGTTKIAWTEFTWNPMSGCTQVSPGCDNCYAKTLTERFEGVPGHYYERGFALTLRPDKLMVPARKSAPKMVFVNSTSDLFHAEVPADYVAQVFAVMAVAGHHTFQVLTKRAGVMASLVNNSEFVDAVADHARQFAAQPGVIGGGKWSWPGWPLPNVWLGVSVEDQARAALRLPQLARTPARVRFASCEPLLGPVNLPDGIGAGTGLDWLIAGGESGPGARAMALEWARSLQAQCGRKGVAFFFKQLGSVTAAAMGVPGKGEVLRDVPADLAVRAYPELT